MTTPNADGTAEDLVTAGRISRSSLAGPLPGRNENIRVSPAVLEAAEKDGEALLRDLRTAPGA